MSAVEMRGDLGVAHARAVAAIGVAAAALAFAAHSPRAVAYIAAPLALVLVLVAATDLERHIIPNAVVLPATAAVLLAHIAIEPSRTGVWILSGLLAGAIFVVPNLVNPALMGMGDVKLAVLLGVGLGWGVIGALLVGLLSVLPVAMFIVFRGGWSARKATVAFGPYLALGGLVVLIAPLL